MTNWKDTGSREQQHSLPTSHINCPAKKTLLIDVKRGKGWKSRAEKQSRKALTSANYWTEEIHMTEPVVSLRTHPGVG